MKATKGRAAARMKDKKEAKKPAENKFVTLWLFHDVCFKQDMNHVWNLFAFRVVGKRKAASQADKSDGKRAKNIASSTNKDPNKPKRPATAFFVFM